MANLISTEGFGELPAQLADKIVDHVQTGSAVGALSQQHAMRFGEVNIVSFTQDPRAEFVEEGAQKGPTTVGLSTVKATPRKAQVTIRYNSEVAWADEDYQIGALTQLADKGAVALARALDLGLFYALNPLGQKPNAGWTNYLNKTTKRVARTGRPDVDIQNAAGLVIKDPAGYDVNGLALTPSLAFDIANLSDTTGRPLYPELGLGANVTSFKGLPTVATTTVAAPEFAAPGEGENYTVPNVSAIVGDWTNGLYWGVQRTLPVQYITSGDPDGQGDLNRLNQVALRLEMVYAWYVFPERFAVVEGDAPEAARKAASK